MLKPAGPNLLEKKTLQVLVIFLGHLPALFWRIGLRTEKNQNTWSLSLLFPVSSLSSGLSNGPTVVRVKQPCSFAL
jgi:hypothetical protein